MLLVIQYIYGVFIRHRAVSPKKLMTINTLRLLMYSGVFFTKSDAEGSFLM